MRRTTRTTEAGTLSKDPWGLLRAVAPMDLPEARKVVEKLVPMMLREQQPDGGWGEHGLTAFQALVHHGLLDELRARPPLPAEWRVVRYVLAPPGVETLTFAAGLLWTLLRDEARVIGLDPQDGHVVRTLAVPQERPVAVGNWDGLAVALADTKRLLRLDATSGEVVASLDLGVAEWVWTFTQVGDEVWMYDRWYGCTLRIDPGEPSKRTFRPLGGPGGGGILAVPDGIWTLADFAAVMVLSDRDGNLLDWAGKPFHGACHGLAWDGQQLWALDRSTCRLCVIERVR